MAELVVGKYKFYPYECERCKKPTLRDHETMLKSIKTKKRQSDSKNAKRPQRRDHNAPPADHRVM